MKNFSFNLLGSPVTKPLYKEFNELITLKETETLRAKVESQAIKELRQQALEDYFISTGLVTVNELDHDLGYHEEGGEYIFHKCSINDEDHEHAEICRMKISEHPEIDKIVEEGKKAMREARDAALHRHDTMIAPLHNRIWGVVNTHLESLGLISKNADGSYPALDRDGRFVTLTEAHECDHGEGKGTEAASFLGKMFAEMLKKAVQK